MQIFKIKCDIWFQNIDYGHEMGATKIQTETAGWQSLVLTHTHSTNVPVFIYPNSCETRLFVTPRAI